MVNEFYIDGVKVSFIDMWDVSEDEPKNYVNFVKSNAFIPEGYRLRRITINAYASGKIDLNYELQGPKFERIRRITGYLTGSTDSWNDAKRAEERDRVKHDF